MPLSLVLAALVAGAGFSALPACVPALATAGPATAPRSRAARLALHERRCVRTEPGQSLPAAPWASGPSASRGSPWWLRLRGGQDDDERKRRVDAADSREDGAGKRPRLAAGHHHDRSRDGGGGRAEKAVVRISRDLLKKLKAVVKEIPEEGVAVAWFAGRYQELHEVGTARTHNREHICASL